ncbi:MFS transporter [Telmatospirillum sp.]|uniref:MFS transporter n=1 Tax=Telmatospirillum sp. TaxID=2079197 RepID=UPI00284A1454|nr:MFS transporter [Telmatospirillum sp.]MDR3441009.1 MFS transporter [Telmatospirillum sp.]
MKNSAVSMSKVAAASFAGAVLEWYDFFIFGTASALVFGELFFPSVDPMAGTIASFATFGVGFLARPIGGIVFGHMGDRIGRKSALIATLLIIGIGTFLIGLLPTYSSAGVWAPVLLVALRLVQGFGLGGEYGGAALMTIEHAAPGRRGFWGSVPQAAASAGILLATGVFSLVTQLPKDVLMDWGWRVPFLLSSVMLIVGLFIRLQTFETPDFEKIKQSKTPGLPLVTLFRTHPRNLLLAFGARLAETVSSNIINAFGIVYVSLQLSMNRSVPLTGVLMAAAVGVIACPLFGALSDRVGRRAVYLGGAAFTALFAFPYFLLLGTKADEVIWLAIIVAYVFGPTAMFAVQATFFSELFGANVRYTGLSIAYQPSAIIGGFTPMIAAVLLKEESGVPWLVAGYLAVISLISLVCASLVRRTAESRAETRH